MYFPNQLCNKTLKLPPKADTFKGKLRTALGDFYMYVCMYDYIDHIYRNAYVLNVPMTKFTHLHYVCVLCTCYLNVWIYIYIYPSRGNNRKS